MSFPRYPKYKDSDVEWLGQVPEHWLTKPLWSSADERNEPNKGMIQNNLLSLSYGWIVRKDISSNDGLLPESFETYQIVKPGDLVFRPTDLQNDWNSLRSAIVEETGIITSAYIAVIPRGPNPQYLHHLFRAYDKMKVFYSMGGGLRQSMKYADLKRIPILLPPLPEQTLIASFLDQETTKIDALVAEQQRLIELLKEKRQAVISHAVTKGLNPKAPMKSSGIEWLGDVPEHWEVVCLKYVVAVPIIDGPHESPTKLDQGIPFVSAESVSGSFIDFEKIWGFISPEDHARYSKRYKPKCGDILMVKLGATTGTSAIVETQDEFNIWVPLAAIRLKSEIEPRFILNVLRSHNLQCAYQLNWTYGTQQTLGLRTISNLRIALPPKDERQEIVRQLDSILPLFELLSTESQRAIDLLQERRTALISAAVTGQIDVRPLTGKKSV
jgi:type I restriction enzyme S subunit